MSEEIKKPRPDLDAALSDAQKEQLAFLRSAGIFYYNDVSELEDDEDAKWLRRVNLNDTFWWASAYCEDVEDEDIETLHELFWNYGWCGVLFWAAKKGKIAPEFNHVKRMIGFVENEERIKEQAGSSSAYAYSKDSYKLG